MDDKEYISTEELCKKIKTSRVTLNVWRKTLPNFPKPVQIVRRLRWKLSEVEEYLEKSKVK